MPQRQPTEALASVPAPGRPWCTGWGGRPRWPCSSLPGTGGRRLDGRLLGPGPPPGPRPVRPRQPAAAAGAPDPVGPDLVGGTGDQPFVLRLQPGRGPRRRPSSGVTVAVYPCLSSVSGFDQSVSAPPSGEPHLLHHLTAAGQRAAGGGRRRLQPLAARCGWMTPRPSPAGRVHHRPGLGRRTVRALPGGGVPGAGRAGGHDHRPGASAASPPTSSIPTPPPAPRSCGSPWSFPLRTAVVAAPAPTTGQLQARPAAALAQPTARRGRRRWSTRWRAVDHEPTVPLTIEASAQTVGALQTSGHQATVNQLSALAADPAVHQFASAPFTPVDASSLVTAGLGDELALQVARGTALALRRGHPSAGRTRSAWASGSPTTDSTRPPWPSCSRTGTAR